MFVICILVYIGVWVATKHVDPHSSLSSKTTFYVVSADKNSSGNYNVSELVSPKIDESERGDEATISDEVAKIEKSSGYDENENGIGTNGDAESNDSIHVEFDRFDIDHEPIVSHYPDSYEQFREYVWSYTRWFLPNIPEQAACWPPKYSEQSQRPLVPGQFSATGVVDGARRRSGLRELEDLKHPYRRRLQENIVLNSRVAKNGFENHSSPNQTLEENASSSHSLRTNTWPSPILKDQYVLEHTRTLGDPNPPKVFYINIVNDLWWWTPHMGFTGESLQNQQILEVFSYLNLDVDVVSFQRFPGIKWLKRKVVEEDYSAIVLSGLDVAAHWFKTVFNHTERLRSMWGRVIILDNFGLNKGVSLTDAHLTADQVWSWQPSVFYAHWLGCYVQRPGDVRPRRTPADKIDLNVGSGRKLSPVANPKYTEDQAQNAPSSVAHSGAKTNSASAANSGAKFPAFRSAANSIASSLARSEVIPIGTPYRPDSGGGNVSVGNHNGGRSFPVTKTVVVQPSTPRGKEYMNVAQKRVAGNEKTGNNTGRNGKAIKGKTILIERPPDDNELFGMIWGKSLPRRVLHQVGHTISQAFGQLSENLPMYSHLSRHPFLRAYKNLRMQFQLPRDQFLEKLGKSAFFLGIGDPLAAPSAIEALEAGTMLILPKFKTVRVINGHPHYTQYDHISYYHRIQAERKRAFRRSQAEGKGHGGVRREKFSENSGLNTTVQSSTSVVQRIPVQSRSPRTTPSNVCLFQEGDPSSLVACIKKAILREKKRRKDNSGAHRTNSTDRIPVNDDMRNAMKSSSRATDVNHSTLEFNSERTDAVYHATTHADDVRYIDRDVDTRITAMPDFSKRHFYWRVWLMIEYARRGRSSILNGDGKEWKESVAKIMHRCSRVSPTL